jgi:hypothetical protein
VFEHDFG